MGEGGVRLLCVNVALSQVDEHVMTDVDDGAQRQRRPGRLHQSADELFSRFVVEDPVE